MTQYKWESGSRRKTDPNVAARELKRIEEKHDNLTADAVVAESKPKRAPLHDEFEWDDAAAAHQFRLVQGRTLIRALVVVLPDDTTRREYALTRSNDGEGNAYKRLDVLIERQDLLHDAIDRLRTKMQDLQRSMTELLDLAHGSQGGETYATVISLAAEAIKVASRAVNKIPVKRVG